MLWLQYKACPLVGHGQHVPPMRFISGRLILSFIFTYVPMIAKTIFIGSAQKVSVSNQLLSLLLGSEYSVPLFLGHFRVSTEFKTLKFWTA